MLIRLLCAHEMTKHVCKISRLNSKRLLRKLQKILGGYFILPHPVYEVVRNPFQPIFGLFEMLYRNFVKLLAPSSNKKEPSLQKKNLKTASKSVDKRQRNACTNNAPLERTARRPRSVTNN